MLHGSFYWSKFDTKPQDASKCYIFVEKSNNKQIQQDKLYTKMHQSPVDIQMPSGI